MRQKIIQLENKIERFNVRFANGGSGYIITNKYALVQFA